MSNKDGNNHISDVNSSKKEKVYRQLKLEIISHRLKAGQPITEEEIVKKYSISRTPVREIFRRLENEGLVKNIAYKGTYVADLLKEDIEEILDIRYALEGLAAKFAANNVTDKDIEEFVKIEHLLLKAMQDEDSVLSFEADTKLHELILTIAGNHRIHTIINNLLAQIHRIRFISGHMPGRINTTVQEHLNIIAAIKERDSDKAEAMMHTHIENTRKLFSQSSEMDEKFKLKLSFLL